MSKQFGSIAKFLTSLHVICSLSTFKKTSWYLKIGIHSKVLYEWNRKIKAIRYRVDVSWSYNLCMYCTSYQKVSYIYVSYFRFVLLTQIYLKEFFVLNESDWTSKTPKTLFTLLKVCGFKANFFSLLCKMFEKEFVLCT